jgi:hypothetical protein
MTLDETNTRTRGQPKRRAKRWLAETAKGCEPGTVSMLKTVYAIVAAAIIAACLVLAPSLSQVEAGAPSATGKADRADARPLAGDCSERPWPYMEASCLRDTRNPQSLAREVRFVPMTAERRPLAKPAVASR